MKRTLAVLLLVCMVSIAVPSEVIAVETDKMTYEVGDIIEFGAYPQNQVVDQNLINNLNSQVLTWQSYHYYSGDGSGGSMIQSNYMLYADIRYNGTDYRAVKFTAFRPETTIKMHYETQSWQDDNGYKVDTIYWFEYSSLQWRILSTKTGLVMCENIIDAQAYCDTIYGSSYKYNNTAQTIYANDYATSSIREWLNGIFLNWAFTENQILKIRQTELKNNAYDSRYNSANTKDRVFLLSNTEKEDNDYGFGTLLSLKTTATDYAKVQGLKNDSWWTRTAGRYPFDAIGVNDYGYGIFLEQVCATCYGVRPVMCVDLDSLRISSFENDDVSTCTLAELTSIDYLAFSDVSYSSVDKSKIGTATVQDIIGKNRWEKEWKNTDIKNSELFAHIKNWVVYDFKENEHSGFAAYIFRNDDDEFVIAYRGSTNFSLLNMLDPDWLENDIYMFLGGNGTQIYEAIQYAKELINTYGADSVTITGHSLGGALCDIVSARFSCYAESFNAAPFLANAYCYYPDEMGQLFSGAENWLFTDHVTEGDFVGTLSLWMKNYIIHKYNQYEDGEHSLASMVIKDGFGKLYLTAKMDSAEQRDTTANRTLYFGTATANILSKPDSFLSYVAYGGNDSDNISTGWGGDVLIGGQGEDILDGGHGDDDYFYYKGDGEDWIFDISGQDALYMMGFSETDQLTLEAEDSFVNILCNGEEILHIAKGRVNNILYPISFTMITHYETNPTSTNITDYLKPRNYKGRITIACPVDVEIIDDLSGEVVYILRDGETGVGAYYTEYGYYYVYQDETGDYVKIADLFEGYSVRIVGTDTGTMNVSVYDITSDGLIALNAVNVPVTGKLVAKIEEIGARKYLLLDEDGDGDTDNRVQLGAEYTVTYNSNGGVGNMRSDTIPVGESLTLPECSFEASSGKEFKAWNINGIEYLVGDTITLNGDTVVMAIWKEVSNTIAPDYNVLSPQTGDNINMIQWFFLFVISFMGMVANIALKRKSLHLRE